MVREATTVKIFGYLYKNNPKNVVKATLQGLASLKSAESVALIRGKSAEEILN